MYRHILSQAYLDASQHNKMCKSRTFRCRFCNCQSNGRSGLRWIPKPQLGIRQNICFRRSGKKASWCHSLCRKCLCLHKSCKASRIGRMCLVHHFHNSHLGKRPDMCFPTKTCLFDTWCISEIAQSTPSSRCHKRDRDYLRKRTS